MGKTPNAPVFGLHRQSARPEQPIVRRNVTIGWHRPDDTRPQSPAVRRRGIEKIESEVAKGVFVPEFAIVCVENGLPDYIRYRWPENEIVAVRQNKGKDRLEGGGKTVLVIRAWQVTVESPILKLEVERGICRAWVGKFLGQLVDIRANAVGQCDRAEQRGK